MKKISKKIISLIISMSLAVTGLPFMVYAKSITPEISLEEFTKQLKALQTEYDGNFASEIIIENGKEFYHIDGEEYPVDNDFETTAAVTENDFEIPLSAIVDYCELPDISTYSMNESNEEITVDKETAEALGFEVEIEEEKAVLTQPYQTQRLIVKSQFDINPLDSVAIVEGYNDLHIVQFDNQESAKQAEEYYNNQMLVEFAEPDLVMSTMEYEDSDEESTVTYGINDYGYHLSWGSEASGIDDYIDYIGDRNNMPEIVVGIIDTGIDVDHDFLKDRIIRTNYNISTSGAENDENDDKGHGTHVAGIIADNTLDNVKIKGYKALNSVGNGSLSDVITAFEYAVADGVNIINMSLSVKGESKTFEEVINAATKDGVIVCVSAGNSGHDASQNCPANIESCLTVGAYGQSKEPGYISPPIWSCGGPLVDVVAPGVSIYSTYLDNGYETLSGTSMACPFVVATAALFMSKDPGIDADGVCDLIQENAKTFVLGIKYFLLYIAKITDYDQYRTEKPVFSMESGRYSDSVTVELSCPEEGAEIYYTLDGSRASKANGILYTEPIVIDKVTKVHAAAYAGDKLKSLQAVADYYITVTDSESNFEIDTNGLIIKYNGTNQYLTIPDTINGIAVTGIGKGAFGGKGMVMMKFPDTLTYIAAWGLSGQSSLKSVYCNNLKVVGERGFYGCRALEEIDLTQLEEVGVWSFGNCSSIREIHNDKLTRIEKASFFAMKSVVSVDLPNLTFVGNVGFDNMGSLEHLNLPNVETLSYGAFLSVSHLETIDLPSLTTITGSHCFAQTINLKELNVPNLRGTLPKKTFWGSGLECIDLPNITDLNEEALCDCFAKVIKLQNVTAVGEGAFSGCHHLEELYLPSATEIPALAFKDCKSLKTIFMPSVTKVESMPDCDGTTFYLSDACNQITFNSSAGYKYTIVAPSGYYAEQWAKENGHTFIPSDSRDETVQNPSNVADLDKSVCTSQSNLRFGFNWNNIEEIEKYAENVEFGFIYSINGVKNLSVKTVNGGSVKSVKVTNLIENNGSTLFNLVIKNIPEKYRNQNVTVRAYVYIDGMYFYSNLLSGYYNDAENITVTDSALDSDTEVEFGIQLCDINLDGIVNSNDYAMLRSYVICQNALTEEQLLAADFNGDGTVDGLDAIALDVFFNAN